MPALPLLALLACAAVTTARPLTRPAPAPRLQPAPAAIAPHWKRSHAAVASDASVAFTIALHGANFSLLSQHMHDIARDGHGRWLSSDQLAQYTAPESEHVAHLSGALAQSGIAAGALTWSPHRDRVTVHTDVQCAERLFPGSQPFRQYTRNSASTSARSSSSPSAGADPSAQTQYIRTTALAIPGDMHYIQHVAGLTDFAPAIQASRPPVHPFSAAAGASPTRSTSTYAERASANPPAGCGSNGTAVDAACIENLYGTAAYSPKGGDGLDVLIMGYAESFVDLADVNLYLSRSDLPTSGTAMHLLDGVSGANDLTRPSLEGSLDTQMVVATQGRPLNNTYLYYAESGSTFAESLNYVLDTPSLDPGVISVSFAAPESAFSPSEATYLCNTIQKLTAQGTTVVFAAGDGGVDSVDGNTTCPSGTFLPTYPSGCPYVLSVGGTVDPAEEWAASWSGGGASNLFAVPTYQASAVANYYDVLGRAMGGRYNASGRGYPDVSAIGTPISVIQGGAPVTAFGTSASAPIWAAIVSLINDARRGAGLGRVGFIHPTLYDNAAALYDVQAGQNYGCGGTGFAASVGWDPVSGLGTPTNLTGLMKAFGVD